MGTVACYYQFLFYHVLPKNLNFFHEGSEDRTVEKDTLECSGVYVIRPISRVDL